MRLALAALLACSLAACGSTGSGSYANDVTGTLVVDGTTREYVIHVPPSYQRAHAAPLVLDLHGGVGTPEGIRRITGMDPIADHNGFIVVYPRGIGGHWNDGRSERLNSEADVHFISALIDKLERDYSIDPKRIDATGISNGGVLAFRLACEIDDRIAAVASVAGSMASALAARCHPASPVSVIMINGLQDPLVPYGGGMVGGWTANAGPVLSVAQAIALWTSLDQCSAQPIVRRLPDAVPDDGTHTTEADYESCRAGSSVELFTIDGGGHTWPGGPQYLPAFLIGKTSHDFNASETIWQFFAAHPKA